MPHPPTISPERTLRLQEVLPEAYTVLHEELASPRYRDACNFYLLERLSDGARGIILLDTALFLSPEGKEEDTLHLLRDELALALLDLNDPLPYQTGWRSPAAFQEWLRDPRGLTHTFMAHMDYGNVFVDDVVRKFA